MDAQARRDAQVAPAHQRHHEVARRTGLRDDNPTGDAITAALSKRANHMRHMPALPHGEVAGAIEAMKASSAWAGTKLCFELMVLTATRSGKVRGAQWAQIDATDHLWTMSVQRMKAKREHRVSLCRRALEILDAARALGGGNPLVFPMRSGRHISASTLLKMLNDLRIAAVPHGSCSSFRGWAAEKTDHPREVIEAVVAL